MHVCVKSFSAARQPQRGWKREKTDGWAEVGVFGAGKKTTGCCSVNGGVEKMDECHSVSASIWTWCVSSVVTTVVDRGKKLRVSLALGGGGCLQGEE